MSDDHKSIYIKNAIWLAVLTATEVGVTYLAIPKAGQVVLLLAFAVTKIMLVALIYMHLRYETTTLKVIAFVPIPAGIIFCLALMYDLPFQWVK